MKVMRCKVQNGGHPDSRRKRVRQMIEHGNSYVAEWPMLKSSHLHLAEFMNPLHLQMTEPYLSMHVLVHWQFLSSQTMEWQTGRCLWVALKHEMCIEGILVMGGFKALHVYLSKGIIFIIILWGYYIKQRL